MLLVKHTVVVQSKLPETLAAQAGGVDGVNQGPHSLLGAPRKTNLVRAQHCPHE